MTAQVAHTLRIVVFPGGSVWPIWVAQACGFFAARDISVEIIDTPGSVFQWEALNDGRADLVVTLMDNIVAYREGQGEVPLVVPDAVALMTLETRRLPSLVVQPDITSYADLRGRVLSVDALATGLAPLLVAMLAQAGLSAEDYQLERVGGVLQRYETLKRGEYAGALFNSPFEGILRDEGFHILDTAQDSIAHYQGHVVAARQGWAEQNRAAVEGVLQALLAALAWLYDPANRAPALQIFRDRMAGASDESAASSYDILFDPVLGFVRDGHIDLDGVAAVVAMRARHGRPARQLADAAAYCDLSFLGH